MDRCRKERSSSSTSFNCCNSSRVDFSRPRRSRLVLNQRDYSAAVELSAGFIDSDFDEAFAFGFFGFRSGVPLLRFSGNNDAAVSFNSVNRCSRISISSANFRASSSRLLRKVFTSAINGSTCSSVIIDESAGT